MESQENTSEASNGSPKSYKEIFLKYTKSTSTHGVKHTWNGKSIVRKSFWGLFLFGMLVGFSYNIISSFVAFDRIPTSTTVYTDEVDKLPFPAVTICNLNGYNSTYLKENNLSDIITAAIFQKKSERETITEQCAAYTPNYPLNTTTLFDTVAEASPSLEHFIVDCHFLGVPCNKSKMFTDYYTPTGNCFTFNARKNERDHLAVTGSGFRHDLELVLNIEQDVYTGSVDSEVGVLVSIHEQDDPALVWESGIHVPVGHSAYLAVTHEQIEDRTDRPNSECIHLIDVPQFKVFTSYDYSYRSCRGECIVQDLVNNCSCLWTSNKKASKYRDCNITDICCVYNVLKYTTNCRCPKLCNHTAYEVVPSYATFPSHKAVKEVAKTYNVTEEKLLANFVKVHVFFESLSISREITERSYSSAELVANIGGSMGLFLGASIISLAEAVILFIDLAKKKVKLYFMSHSFCLPVSESDTESDEQRSPKKNDSSA